jgi:hypothetical protein
MNDNGEVIVPKALTMKITNMYADGTVKILFSEFIRPLSYFNFTLEQFNKMNAISVKFVSGLGVEESVNQNSRR